MSETTYTLARILPFVRQALKGSGNLEYRTYLLNVWRLLEDAGVPGVIRTPPDQMYSGQVYQYDRTPYELRAATSEAFFHLFQKGYITLQPPDAYLNPPAMHRYDITRRGAAWFNGDEPFPEEADWYMAFLRRLVPCMDAVIEQYVVEALTAFEREAFFAASVMLGAASEKAIYLLADSMLGAIAATAKRAKLQSALDSRGLLKLLDLVRDTVQAAHAAKVLPYTQFEGSITHLASLFEAIRVQRNDAVHPMNARVSGDSVRLLLHSFPYSLSKVEELRVWFAANPASI